MPITEPYHILNFELGAKRPVFRLLHFDFALQLSNTTNRTGEGRRTSLGHWLWIVTSTP